MEGGREGSTLRGAREKEPDWGAWQSHPSSVFSIVSKAAKIAPGDPTHAHIFLSEFSQAVFVQHVLQAFERVLGPGEP